jgi:hypothetical protein
VYFCTSKASKLRTSLRRLASLSIQSEPPPFLLLERLEGGVSVGLLQAIALGTDMRP